ncbi:uncharacterized protein LOC113473189 [Diaphorina citri]|uniref:Uncharacterized protein LOC113473189 n=1 Tax=Diaphorina citri TaxID=121845 RepID=A0A3Q0JK72_DIACI|nr:uncharacterized protein LOC113473189 [Diaphorina citri]
MAQQILQAVSVTASLSQQADVADKVVAVSPGVCAISTSQTDAPLNSSVAFPPPMTSQMLREIQRLAGDAVPEAIIRGLWLKKLPLMAQQILQAVSVTASLSQQADVADKVVAVSPGVCAISTSQTDVPLNSSVAFPPPMASSSYDNQIADLTKKVSLLLQTLQDFVSSSHQSRSHSCQPRSQSRSRSQSAPSQYRYCSIHYKFRNKARKCSAPDTCKFLADQGNAPTSPAN